MSVTITDGQTDYSAGDILTYTITVTNNGPNPIGGSNITVTNLIPTDIAIWTWWRDSTLLGVGNTNVTDIIPFDLPAGSSVVYTVYAATSPSASADLINEVEVSLFEEYSDSDLGNNSDSDTDLLGFSIP